MGTGLLKWIIIALTACWIDAASDQCGVGCSSCFPGFGNADKCTGCLERYRLEGNTCIQCPDKCRKCLNDNSCTLCDSPYFGSVYPHCNKICPSNCSSDGCDAVNGHCFGCHEDFYGARCEEKCSLCRNNRCGASACLEGCIPGYFEVKSSFDNSYCSPCKDNCTDCSNFTQCSNCQDGFVLFRADYPCMPCTQYINQCSKCNYKDGLTICYACQAGFRLENNTCFAYSCLGKCSGICAENGTCIEGCQDGFTGDKCDTYCNTKCKTCDQFDRNKCVTCMDNTQSCIFSCSTKCVIHNGSETCNMTEFCLNGCLNGYWGSSCRQSCNSGCKGSCNQMNGQCLECHRNLYGLYCDYNCSKNCIADNLFNAVCIQATGTCIQGCKAGFDGPFCNTSIQPTVNSIRDSSSTTTRKSESSTQSPSENRSQSDSQAAKGSTATAIGAGVGGGVAVATILVIVVIMRKRRTEKDNRYCFCFGDTPGKSSSSTVTLTDNQPAKPEKQSAASHEDESYVYALPNKHKKSLKVKVDISNPHTNTSSIATIDLDAETDEEESNIDETIRLEDIDDGEAVVMEREPEVPVSDTYYNMAGLLRSRIQIQNLLEYLRNKRDFETEFEKLPKGLTRTCHEALTPFNRGKNRYNGIYAYDATRVVLRNSAYINACYMEGQGVSRAYIASLGPTKNTMNKFSTFWEMVWQENTQTIVMLTNLVENDKMKCEQYWPDDGSMRHYGEFSVTTMSEQIHAEFVVRELHVVKARDTRKVMQYHYTAWPDKSNPDTVVSLLEFRDKVKQNQTKGAGPIVVHCSAGIGRTGTYIALDMLIKEGITEHSVDIFGCVIGLRGQRTNMVQNVEQYRYLHHCVVYALTCNPKPLNVDQLTSSNDQSEDQFQALENIPSLPDTDAVAVGANKRRKENRKGADIPGDLHRVKLKQTKKDYVNAVYVDTPMPNTVDEFVTLIYQEDVEKIVCLDDESFTDKNVAQYLPPDSRVSKFGHTQLLCVKHETHDIFIQREITLSKIGSAPSNEKKIMHYQYRGWSTEDNIPTRQTDFLQFLNTVNNKSGHGRDTILVHCLDGAKKSGLFCAVAIMLKKLSVEKEVSVINTVCQVRGRRRSALQNYEQFKFCYTCIQEHLETSEAKTYYNIL